VYEKQIEVEMKERLMKEWRGQNNMRGKAVEVI
jgi:hypothetical protein